jgi:phage repressor protein C with HTH and peptisase S24 domain
MEQPPLHEALRKARKSAGLTLAKAAEGLGLSIASVQQWETNRSQPSADNLLKAMKLYGVDFSAGSLVPATAEPPSARVEELPEGLPHVAGRRDLPVKGIAVGGSDGEGDFRFNGEVVDYLPRPPMLAHRRRAFAVQVSNESMYPRFSEGVRLYVDPDQHARPGDDVIIEMHAPRDGEAGAAYVKTLVKRTPTKVVVQQFNPPKEISFDLDKVRSIYRVIPWSELLGI